MKCTTCNCRMAIRGQLCYECFMEWTRKLENCRDPRFAGQLAARQHRGMQEERPSDTSQLGFGHPANAALDSIIRKEEREAGHFRHPGTAIR